MTNEIKVFAGMVLGTLALIFGASFFLSNKEVAKQTVDPVVLVSKDDHATGSATAKVTVVEFSDFQCPACVVAEPIVAKILEKYSGKINFIYRHFPLVQAHPLAYGAAKAAEAAGKQGKFWEMYKVLFAKSPALEEAQLRSYAKDLGLDMAKFEADFASDAVNQRILDDQAAGNRAGLSATPTFYINGTKFTGVLKFEEFSKEIDSRL